MSDYVINLMIVLYIWRHIQSRHLFYANSFVAAMEEIMPLWNIKVHNTVLFTKSKISVTVNSVRLFQIDLFKSFISIDTTVFHNFSLYKISFVFLLTHSRNVLWVCVSKVIQHKTVFCNNVRFTTMYVLQQCTFYK